MWFSALVKMAELHFHRLIILEAEVLRGINGPLVPERRPRVDERARNIRFGARNNLVQVYRDVQPVGVHPYIADSQCGIRVEFPFDRYIPLRRLRIAIMRVGGLLDRSNTFVDFAMCRTRSRHVFRNFFAWAAGTSASTAWI